MGRTETRGFSKGLVDGTSTTSVGQIPRSSGVIEYLIGSAS